MTQQSSPSLFPPAVGGDNYNFQFAFNSATFSDRVLKVVILADVFGPTSDGERAPPRKRRRKEDDDGNDDDDDDDDDAIATNKNDKDDEPLERNETSYSVDFRNILRFELFHVSSAILAAKSQFFFKLFSNGMRESNQKDATLQINASEEAAFKELLRFMYGHKLASTSHPFVLDLVMIADKFEVPSCKDYYSQLALCLPMTEESSLLYLNLPSSLAIASNIQPMTDAAEEFLLNKYKDIVKFLDKVLTLPLAAIQAIFSSDVLEVQSEDRIFDLLEMWAHTHYPNLEARREIFTSKLAPLIRFPQISCTKLRKILASEDQYSDIIMKLVSLGLVFKAQAPHSLRTLAPQQWFIERAYSVIPIRMMEFETPNRQCIVYMDLKKEKLAKTLPRGKIISQTFHLGGQDFFLKGYRSQSSVEAFCVFLGIQGEISADFMIGFEFSVRAKPLGGFESKYKSQPRICSTAKVFGLWNLFRMSWASLMADDSRYFIDEVLHLSAEVTIMP